MFKIDNENIGKPDYMAYKEIKQALIDKDNRIKELEEKEKLGNKIAKEQCLLIIENNKLQSKLDKIKEAYNRLLKIVPRGSDEMLDAYYQGMDNVILKENPND